MAIVLSNDGIQTVYRIKKRELGVTCDICGKFIEAVDGWDKDAGTYYKVTTGHNSWGNDSCESIVCRDVCPDCIHKFVADYLPNGCNTAYIEIETKQTYPCDHWEED